jgi:hypothetical protein
MPRIAIVLLGLMFVVAAAPAARAQVTLHVAKIQVTGIHREALAADQASPDARGPQHARTHCGRGRWRGTARYAHARTLNDPEPYPRSTRATS